MFTATCDVWADLRSTIPFPEATVNAMYSHHVIEPLPDLELHVRAAYRCLNLGGMFRIARPHEENAIRNSIEGDSDWFDEFLIRRRSIGDDLRTLSSARGSM
jgi:predicted SAM-dependent methyltransferase